MRIKGFERIRNPQQQEEGRAPLWLMGITDLITLLLAFFILLFATSAPKSDTWNTASESVKSRFGRDQDETYIKGQAGHKDAEKTWESEERDPGLNLDYLYSVVRQHVESDPSLSSVKVWHNHDTVIISLGAELSFPVGQSRITKQGQALLNTLADYLVTLPNTLEVVGYADQTPLKSDVTFNSNWHLSLERAYNVADILKARGYEAPIDVRGKGVSDADILSNKTQQESQADLARRVDLRLHLLQP